MKPNIIPSPNTSSPLRGPAPTELPFFFFQTWCMWLLLKHGWPRALLTSAPVQMHMLTLAPGLMSSACVNSETSNQGRQRRPNTGGGSSMLCCRSATMWEMLTCVYICTLLILLPSRQPFAGDPPSRLLGCSFICLASIPPNVFHCFRWDDHVQSLNTLH